MGVLNEVLNGMNVSGVSVVTDNSSDGLKKIFETWSTYMSRKSSKDGWLVAVYSDYMSDKKGSYKFTVGEICAVPTDSSMDVVKVSSGKYHVIKIEGDTPEETNKKVQQTWFNIWGSNLQRRFDTDFELYKSPTNVEIYIGIK